MAYDLNLGIGYNQSIPWKLSSDLRRFKAITWGHHLVMGRKTFESIGKPLPGRTTIVISRNPDYQTTSGIFVTSTLENAFEYANKNGEEELFICGGRSIYKEGLKFADRIHLTNVHTRSSTNIFFPEYDETLWREVFSFRIPRDIKNEHSSSFHFLKRYSED